MPSADFLKKSGFYETVTEVNNNLHWNLRFPLTVTYHGCPASPHLPAYDRYPWISYAK